jgi:hypothetical protein
LLYQQKQNATNGNGTTRDTLGKVTFPISSHRFPLDNKETNEILMESKRIQSSPCLDNERLSSMNHDKHIPAELKTLESSFHTNISKVFPKKYNSESDDTVDSGMMGNHEAAATCLEIFDTAIDCDGNVKEMILEPIKLYPPSVEGIEQFKSKSSLVYEVTWILYKHCHPSNYSKSFFEPHHPKTVNRGVAMRPAHQKHAVLLVLPHDALVEPSNKKRNRNLH